MELVEFMQLETEQRVGAHGYKKKKKAKTEQCKREASFSLTRKCSRRIYVFICLLLGSLGRTKSSQKRADRLGEFLR